MQTLKKPIGILGGTFDPVHHGHLRMAIELGEALQLERIHILPCYEPVHRLKPTASPEDRFAMVQTATSNSWLFKADDCEIKRKSASYTIDTLLEMRKAFPNTPLCLFVGIDAFSDFLNWHRPMEILEHAHLVIANRPHYELPQKGPLLDLLQTRLQENPQYIHKNIAGGILMQQITSLEISSSQIRQLIASKRNPRYLLPDSVYDYIMHHHIYDDNSII